MRKKTPYILEGEEKLEESRWKRMARKTILLLKTII